MYKPDFSNLPTNPLKELRDNKKLNIAELSRAAGVTTQQIRDLENGLSQNVPNGLTRVFAADIPGEILDRQYNEWRRIKRGLINLPPVESLAISSDVHPLAQYREKLGWRNTVFCDYLCIPRFVLMNYEAKQRRMPRVLRNEALPQANLSQIDIARLANLGDIFYSAREQRLMHERGQARS